MMETVITCLSEPSAFRDLESQKSSGRNFRTCSHPSASGL